MLLLLGFPESHYAQPKKDMIGHCYTGSPAGQTLPTWGSEPILGTNPVAWAAPADEMPPFLFDIATSQVAGNKIELTRPDSVV